VTVEYHVGVVKFYMVLNTVKVFLPLPQKLYMYHFCLCQSETMLLYKHVSRIVDLKS